MSTRRFNSQSYSASEQLVVNRWTAPVEAFVPIPEYTSPIKSVCIENLHSEDLDFTNNQEVVLAHETEKRKADQIVKDGFKPTNEEMSSLRDRAVFGWLNEQDIGYYTKKSDPSCDTVVLFEAPEKRVYVSSYSSSAYLLGIGDISPNEYEREHVMKYTEFKEMVLNKSSLIDHLDYDTTTFLNI